MNIKNTFSSWVKAIALSLWISVPITSAQSQTLQGFEEIMQYQKQLLDSWASRCFSNHDFREYFNGFHIVKAWENISLIALSHGFSYEHLLQILQNIPEPDRQKYLWDLDMDTPSRIRPGDRIPLLDANYIHRYRRYESQYQLQAQHNRIIEAWENNDTVYLDEHFSFHITPERPISQWLTSSLRVLGAMWQRDIRANAPANVDSRFITDAVCAHQDRRWDKISINPNDPSISLAYRQLVMEYNLDAWMFSDAYVDSDLYSIPEEHDWRDMFSERFVKWVHPVRSASRDEYFRELVDVLEYFSRDGIPGTKIPTKFLYTNAQPLISSYRWGQNHASHVISYVWEYVSDPFIAWDYTPMRPIEGFELWENWIELWDFLTYLAQDQADMLFLLNPVYHNQIKERIALLADYIEFWVNGEKLDVAAALSLWNIRIHAADEIRLWGSLARDGFHLYTSLNEQERAEMTTRLRPLWVHIASGVMFPTNIIVPWEEVQNMGFWGEHWEILSSLVVRDYVSLRPGENAKDIISEYISQELFSQWLSELSAWELRKVDAEYRLQSMWHQLYGNQNFWGTQWKEAIGMNQDRFQEESATFPFAPIEIFDTSNMEDIYSEYITARKIDYYSLLRQEYCSDLELPFLRVRFFPGDTLTSAVYQLSIQLHRTNPWLSRQILNLDQIKRIHFVNILLWERISQGNIAAGEGFRIGREELFGALRQVNHGIFQNDFELMDSRGNISFHAELIESVVDNPDWVLLMKYILANESYVNNSDDLNNIMYRVLRVEWLSRRWAKSTLYDLRESWITDMLNNEILPVLTDFRIPTTSSQWDFQMRFPNLYVQNYISQWPARDLTSILREIRDESGRFSEDISLKQAEFPDIVRSDLLIVEEILAILEYDHERVRGREVAEKLRSLMRYDPGDASNIIGFIISTHLAYELLQENIENFVHLLTLSGVSIADLNADEQTRVMAATARCFNMWAKVCQIAFSDIYVNRFLEWLNKKYDIWFEFPQVERTGWVRNQKIYRRFIFINRHLPAYLEFIEQIERNNILSDVEKRAIEVLKNAFEDIQNNPLEYQNILFRIFWDSDIQEGLKSLWLDDFILPTQEENAWETTDLARTLLADYANPEVIENRVQKPVTTNAEKFAVLWSLWVFMWYAFQQFVVNPLWYLLVFFPLKKIWESQRILYWEYKRYRRKRKRKKLKKEFDAILNTPHEKELDAYISQREKDIQWNILISNDPNYPSAFHNYTEGKNYQIWNEEIVYHPLYRPEPLDLENYIQKNLVEHVQELTEIQVLYIISGDYWHHAVEYK